MYNRILNYILVAVIIGLVYLIFFGFSEPSQPFSQEIEYDTYEHLSVLPSNTTLALKVQKRFTTKSSSLIVDVVKYADKYARPDFPTKVDILSVIAIESSFNPKAVSNLKTDPAIGLTQIRPGQWSHKIKKNELISIENQVKYAAEILEINYQSLNKDPKLALHAYNLGLTAAKRGDRNMNYVDKFQREKSYLINS